MKNSFRIILIGSLIYISLGFLYSSTIKFPVIIKNIRNAKGRLSIGVFKDADSFEKEKPYKIILIPKKELVGGTVKASIELEPGVYALSILDDENSDYKMEYNMVGLPKEGFGFANYYHGDFSKPNFKQFLVVINSSEKSPILFNLRYIL